MTLKKLFLSFLFLLACCFGLMAGDARKDGRTELTQKYFYAATAGMNVEEKAFNASLGSFYHDNPDIVIKSWNALKLPGDMFQQADLLAFAGGIAPDIQKLFFHQIQFFAEQKLVAPLNEFIGEDMNGDGVLSDDEVKWKPWLQVPDIFRKACMVGDKIYAIPTGCYANGFLFRRDLFQKAGLDPDNPPRTLDEFWKACQKLTEPERKSASGEVIGQWALGSGDLVFHSFFFACGAQFINIEWVDSSKKVQAVSKLEAPYEEYLRKGLKPRYLAVFDSKESEAALAWIWKFKWQPWVRDADGAIRDLSEEEAAKTPGVIRGVVRPSSSKDTDRMSMMIRGMNVMAFTTFGDRNSFLNEQNLGILPFPVLNVGDPPPSPLLPMTIAMNSELKDPAKRKAAWKWISYAAGPESARIQNSVFMENGMIRILSVYELRRSGMTESLDELPVQWRKAEDEIFSGRNILPFVNGWLAIEQEIIAGIANPMLGEKDFNCKAALKKVCTLSNEKIFGRIPVEIVEKRRMMTWGVILCSLFSIIFFGYFIFKYQIEQARSAAKLNTNAKPVIGHNMLFAMLMLIPALLIIFIFQYYPVLRGALMAFQDYKIVGGASLVGIDNFVEGLFTSRFWIATGNTILFLVLNLSLGFVAPIILAVLLTEIPRGTTFFRTVYYLPAVTAGLVVSLLWMQMFDPTSNGMFNRMLQPIIVFWNNHMPALMQIAYPVRWLNDSRLAMICTIIPAVWASTGPGCLIYLAALKGIPEDYYEAADLDGANIMHKFLHITVPSILPLILINFIGAFIGTFHSMGNIFVMTGGGPNYATHVMALEIWQNAFLYLRFGVATAQGWIVAAALIGFVMLQIRILSRMDWRQSGN